MFLLYLSNPTVKSQPIVAVLVSGEQAQPQYVKMFTTIWTCGEVSTCCGLYHSYTQLQGVRKLFPVTYRVFGNSTTAINAYFVCQTCVNSLLTCVMDVFIVAGVIVSASGHQNN